MPVALSGTTTSITGLQVQDYNLVPGIVKMDLLFSGAANGGAIKLKFPVTNYQKIIICQELSTDTNTPATISFGDDDWHQTIILTRLHIDTGISHNDPQDDEDVAVIGDILYYNQTGSPSNNRIRAVFGVKFNY